MIVTMFGGGPLAPGGGGPGRIASSGKTRVYGIPLFTEELEVTLWEPPRRLILAHRSFVRGVGEWNLELAEGGCIFTWSETLSLPVPLLGELGLEVHRPFMRRLMRGALAGLQGLVESEAA